MTAGDRIKERRMEIGMTQQELADAVGYKGKTAISKIEAGERDIRQSKIKLFADALGTSVEYIMGWEETVPKLDELQQKILDAYDKLPDAQKIALYEFINSLTE